MSEADLNHAVQLEKIRRIREQRIDAAHSLWLSVQTKLTEAQAQLSQTELKLTQSIEHYRLEKNVTLSGAINSTRLTAQRNHITNLASLAETKKNKVLDAKEHLNLIDTQEKDALRSLKKLRLKREALDTRIHELHRKRLQHQRQQEEQQTEELFRTSATLMGIPS